MRIKIDQQAVKVTSLITKQDVENAMNFAPKSLIAVDEHGNQVYAAALADVRGELNMNCVMFNGHDAEGYLTVSFTIPMEADPDARLEEFKLALGKQLAQLAKYEAVIKAQIAAQVGEVNAAFSNLEMI